VAVEASTGVHEISSQRREYILKKGICMLFCLLPGGIDEPRLAGLRWPWPNRKGPSVTPSDSESEAQPEAPSDSSELRPGEPSRISSLWLVRATV